MAKRRLQEEEYQAQPLDKKVSHKPSMVKKLWRKVVGEPRNQPLRDGQSQSLSFSPDTEPDFHLFKAMLNEQNLYFSDMDTIKAFYAYRTIRDNAPYYGDRFVEGKPNMLVTQSLMAHKDAFTKMGGVQHFINLVVVPAAQKGIYAQDLPTMGRLWQAHAGEWAKRLFEVALTPNEVKTIVENEETLASRKMLIDDAKPYEAEIARRIMMNAGQKSTKHYRLKIAQLAHEFRNVMRQYPSFEDYLDQHIAQGEIHDRLSSTSDAVDKTLGIGRYVEIGPDISVIQSLQKQASRAVNIGSLTNIMKQQRTQDPFYKNFKEVMAKQKLNLTEKECRKVYEAYRAIRDRASFYGFGTDEENSEVPMAVTKELMTHKAAFIRLGGFEYFTLLVVVPASQAGVCARADLPVIARKWKENAQHWTTNLFNRAFTPHEAKTDLENKKTIEARDEIAAKAYPYAVEIYELVQKNKQTS